MKRFLQLACAVGLLACVVDMDYAVAAGTCSSDPKPGHTVGSLPGKRSPIALRTDPTDDTYCTLKENHCVAPTLQPTVVESAPSCTCECR
jgi:hypothetical protein